MKRPTRKELLMVIGRLQTLISSAKGRANDRNPNRAADLDRILGYAHDLCMTATGYDDIVERKGEWGDEAGEDRRTIDCSGY